MTESTPSPLAKPLRTDIGRSPLWHFCAVVLLVVSTLAVFSQVRTFDFLGYDDPYYIGSEPPTRIIQDGITSEGLTWIWTAHAVSLWEPLSYLSHMVDAELFGCAPEAGGKHHITNLLLHVANVLLVYWLGVLLFRSSPVALVAAGLFGLHPMRAETVGWVSERKGVLCAFFMLLAICSYVKYSRKLESNVRGALWMIFSVAMTVLAMMSKPAAFVIPLLIGLIDIYPLRRCGFESDDWKLGDVIVRQLREKWMFVAAAFLLTAVSLAIQYGSHREKFIGALSPGQRIGLMPSVFTFYLQRSLWPQNLNFEYPPPIHQLYFFVSVVLVLGMTILALVNYRRYSGLFFAWGWFLASLFPVCGLVYVGSSFTTDRYTYFAHIGLFLGIAAQVSQFVGADEKRKRFGIPAFVIGALLLAVCGWFAAQQTAVWKNNFVLFENSYNTQKRVDIGFTNLAVAHERAGRPKIALTLLEELQQRRAGVVDYTTLYNMGRLYGELSKDPANGISPTKQVEMYKLALKANPNHSPSLHNFGKIIMEHAQGPKDFELAYRMLLKASTLTEHMNPLYLHNLSTSCMVRSEWSEAQQWVERALKLPIDSAALKEQLLLKQKQIEERAATPQ